LERQGQTSWNEAGRRREERRKQAADLTTTACLATVITATDERRPQSLTTAATANHADDKPPLLRPAASSPFPDANPPVVEHNASLATATIPAQFRPVSTAPTGLLTEDAIDVNATTIAVVGCEIRRIVTVGLE
jgi:hypothetical protein